MNSHYQDNYIRVNPRSKAQCDPILYRDNYKPYFKSDLSYQVTNDNFCNLETFANIQPVEQVQIVKSKNLPVENVRPEFKIEKNALDLDNNSFVQDISCQGSQTVVDFGFQKKMYDVNPRMLMKEEILGNIKEIDRIHNNKIKREMSYGDMKLHHFKNTMKNLHYNLNPKVIHAHERNFQREFFFQDK